MSPRIVMVPAMQPSRLPFVFSSVGGMTSATGSPKRVTRTGFRVLRTSSRMPRHFALNSEMATSFTFASRSVYTMVNDYGQLSDQEEPEDMPEQGCVVKSAVIERV